MRKTFFSHLILMVFLNLLIKPLAIFGIDAEVQNQVGAEEYGLYFALLNFTYLFNILLDFGITNFNIKYIAQYPHLAKQYIGKIIPIRVLFLLIFIVLNIGLAFLLGYNSRQFEIVYCLIFNQFLISLILYFRSYFSGLHLFKLDIFLSVLDKFLLIIIGGYFLYFNQNYSLTIKDYVYIQSLTLILTSLIALILLLQKVGIPKLKWNKSFSLLIIRKSYPYAILIILMMLYSRIDSVMIERILPNGKYEAGIYAQGYRLLDAFFMFASLFSSLLFPIFAKIIKTKQDFKPLLFSASNLLLPGAILVVFCCYFDGQFLLDLFYTERTILSMEIFGILILSFVPICIVLIFGTLLTAGGNLQFLNRISFLGIILNIISNLIFIPIYGAKGAAMTSLVTQSFVALIQLVYSFKKFEIKFQQTIFLKYVGLISLVFLVIFVNKESQLNFNLSLQILTFGLIYLLLVQLLDWKTFLKFIKK